ncbi:MAG: YraN family protein [Anaerolineales bacterium]|jgi:putative endonuclease
MKNSKQSLGRWGENLAANHLTKNNYTILEMNTRTPYGEIDLIASKDGVIVFIEVKTRTSTKFGLPEESINQRKQAHILSSAQHYIQEHPQVEGAWRIDVIAIQRFSGNRPPLITHFENAVQS